MADKWIQGAIEHPGSFTAKANKKKMSAIEYAKSLVGKDKSNVSEHTKRQAALAITLSKMREKKG